MRFREREGRIVAGGEALHAVFPMNFSFRDVDRFKRLTRIQRFERYVYQLLHSRTIHKIRAPNTNNPNAKIFPTNPCVQRISSDDAR